MGQTNLEAMKEELQKIFQSYIAGMDEKKLFEFMITLDAGSAWESLCGGKVPETVLDCGKCSRRYGHCEEYHDARDLTKVCRERFYHYCREQG